MEGDMHRVVDYTAYCASALPARYQHGTVPTPQPDSARVGRTEGGTRSSGGPTIRGWKGCRDAEVTRRLRSPTEENHLRKAFPPRAPLCRLKEEHCCGELSAGLWCVVVGKPSVGGMPSPASDAVLSRKKQTTILLVSTDAPVRTVPSGRVLRSPSF